jgi:hypothetical protein
MVTRHASALSLAVTLAFTWACGSDDPGSGGDGGANGSSQSTASGSTAHTPPADLYTDAISRIVIEIDYAAGAAPYTGSVIGFGDTWDIFETNAAALFTGAGGKVIDVPTELEGMQELQGIASGDFTSDAILAIAAEHRDELPKGDTATFYVVWLDGRYDDGSGPSDGILGVSLRDTGVIAMFKPVIESTRGAPGLNVERFVEQATLVHEFGHAVGLVDAGIGTASDHQDTEHGAHCTNQDCVMYYAMEGTSGAIEFVTSSVISADSILFGAECLEDTARAAER